MLLLLLFSDIDILSKAWINRNSITILFVFMKRLIVIEELLTKKPIPSGLRILSQTRHNFIKLRSQLQAILVITKDQATF